MGDGTPRRRRGVAVAALTGAVILGTVGSVEPGAQAAPDSIDQAKVRLAQLDEQTSKIQEDYTKAQAALDKAQKDLNRSQKDLNAQSAKVEAMRKALGRVALTDYQSGGGVSATTQLVTSGDSSQFLSKLATMQNVTDRTNEQFQDFQAQRARLSSLKSQAQADQATIKVQRDQQAKLLADAKKKEQEAKKLLDRLTAQQSAQTRQAAQALTVKGDKATIPALPEGVSARAKTALSFAMAQVGKPYVWGGTGPNGYDCSGLMLVAWSKAGVGLPRTAAAQYAAGRPVAASDLQPGDLVFFYPGITHVGMYIGGGKYVHASNPRTGIKISDLSHQPSYQGARRFG
ncbi:NlpC/P60 family protein [Cutibacterium sp.]|uniref:C40 family peptidase n=1 Tax=Cutibacterium sp. TaxID=1912221 RepID=UPI0026DAECFD|nr:NlpC/P60 family protein [Cutibacterium sp.]MDO4411609.1 NlpC/P60 family protein [Cutibacterium sp.]